MAGLITALNVMAIIVALMAAGVNFAYALTPQRRKSKKPLRVYVGLSCIYFALLYSMALLFPSAYLIRSGVFTRIGLILVLCLLIAEVIADWRWRTKNE